MKWAQGYYKLKNPGKYIGNSRPRFRSSWEFHFMKFLDENPNIINWASEPLRINYTNPATNKKTNYVPDFLIKYQDKDKNQITELIEIKPSSQTSIKAAGKSKMNKIHAIINEAKWTAAAAWAKSNNIRFRILTEHDLFKTNKNK
jgi:hypothetical protein